MKNYMVSVLAEEDDYTTYRYVMTVDAEKVGMADVMHTDGDDWAYIERIDIDEPFQNKGYGTSFIKYLCGEYGDIIVAPDNDDAKRLYDRLGFEDSEHDYFDQGFGVYKI